MNKINRRQALQGTAATLGALGASHLFGASVNSLAAQNSQATAPAQNRLKQSVARWCFSKMPLVDLCRAARAMDLKAIDLLGEDEWQIAKDHGLVCSMGWAPKDINISDGLNNRANHDRIIAALTRLIPSAAKAGVPNVIAFFGNRRGMGDREGIDNCVIGLNRIKKIAEDANVTVCLELLNSKIDHKDYQGDRTPFGVEVMKAVGSTRVKLLYDIYHMQIMEGDVIRTIRDYHQYIGHYHTAGVPGRHELDSTQELNYRPICEAIVATGFTGYLAHEFIPQRDPIASLREAATLCNV
jgi:hydroxypyruvate isomerase